MADSKESKTKGEREPTTKGPGDAGSSTDSKPKKRRLGRGLGSLVALPVDIDSGEPRMSGSAAVGTDTPDGVPPIGGRLANLTTPDEPTAFKGAAPKEKEAPISEGNPTPQGQIQLLEVALIQPNQHRTLL